MSIVEVTTFRLREGFTDESFLTLDKRLQTELVYGQPGILRRTTARHGEDWLVVTLWATEADAAAFQRSAQGDVLQVQFEDAVEAGSLHLTRYTTLD